ncbi:DUF481 domain-containing protein [Candidatus Neomarinimicrobiota bacterium]
MFACFKNLHTHSARLILMILSVIFSEGLAQVNTEAMRKEDLKPGTHFEIGGATGYTEGNSSLFQNRSMLRLDYVSDLGHIFVTANYRLGRKDKASFINKGFSHLRGIRPLQGRLSAEFFAQTEFNEFIKLAHRNLLGTGMRMKWDGLETFHPRLKSLRLALGMGLMYEREALLKESAGDPVHGYQINLLRSTNYVVLAWKPKDNINVQTTAYFQIDTKRFKDYRVLTQSNLIVGLSKRLSLTIDMNMRYDSEPPGNVKGFDLEIINGATYKFR